MKITDLLQWYIFVRASGEIDQDRLLDNSIRLQIKFYQIEYQQVNHSLSFTSEKIHSLHRLSPFVYHLNAKMNH